jgi:Phage integrase, N-terminal SAM-like domain
MAVSVKERLKQTSKKNQEWYKGYEEYLVKANSSRKTIAQYLNAVINLYTFYEDKDIDLILPEDIQNFLLQYDKASTYNFKFYAIKSFFTFLSKHTRLRFDVSELSELSFSSAEVKSDYSNVANPLTIDEIVRLRKSLERNQDYRRWFTFEMIYQYGFTLEEVSRCTKKTYDIATRRFSFKPNVEMNDTVHYLISQNILPDKKVATSTLQSRITELERYLDRKVKYNDIIKTRERTFFRCPKCGTPTECIPSNWVIFEYSIDHSKWMVCKVNCGTGESNE